MFDVGPTEELVPKHLMEAIETKPERAVEALREMIEDTPRWIEGTLGQVGLISVPGNGTANWTTTNITSMQAQAVPMPEPFGQNG